MKKHPNNRAARRQHRQRVINHRCATISWARNALQRAQATPHNDHYIAATKGKLAKTGVPCSCWMCGNPRRTWGGQTLHEHRADACWKDGVVEWLNGS